MVSAHPHTHTRTHAHTPRPAGARRIVRFEQSIVLGPASALTSTQGLAARLAARAGSDAAAHPALAGLPPPPALLPDHPASRRVTMRVKVRGGHEGRGRGTVRWEVGGKGGGVVCAYTARAVCAVCALVCDGLH